MQRTIKLKFTHCIYTFSCLYINMTRLEVCKMVLRGEQDDPSDLSATSPRKLDPVMGWGPDQ